MGGILAKHQRLVRLQQLHLQALAPGTAGHSTSTTCAQSLPNPLQHPHTMYQSSQAPSVLCFFLLFSFEQATAAAAGRLTRAAQHQQHIDDSDVDAAGSDDSASEEDGAIDSDGSDACGAAAAAGEDDEYTTGGRSERAGRSLRNTIRKPPPSVRAAAAACLCWCLCSMTGKQAASAAQTVLLDSSNKAQTTPIAWPVTAAALSLHHACLCSTSSRLSPGNPRRPGSPAAPSVSSCSATVNGSSASRSSSCRSSNSSSRSCRPPCVQLLAVLT